MVWGEQFRSETILFCSSRTPWSWQNDLALAPPAHNDENTNNPLLAVASSEIVLPDCSQDVEGGSSIEEQLSYLSKSVTSFCRDGLQTSKVLSLLV